MERCQVTERGRLLALLESPRYTAARALARFPAVRTLVRDARSRLRRRETERYLATRALTDSGLADAPPIDQFVQNLLRDGFAPGLRLRPQTVDSIVRFAATSPMYADRNPALGFRPNDRALATTALGKPILLAQYFNTRVECAEIAELSTDPYLESVAAQFLGSRPTLVGASLWWTFPVDADEADRERHAHRFHRDVDDFAFVKFFFYLTDVGQGDGAHVCVRGSHTRPAVPGFRERLRLRRYSDDEIRSHHDQEHIVEIRGPAGTGFAENTLCLHKGLTPERSPRLLLQFEFALFDHHVMHDERPTNELHLMDIG